MEPFSGSLTLWVICRGSILMYAYLVHNLLKNTRHKSRTLIRLNRFLKINQSKKKIIRALTIVLALMFLKGIASGNLVEVHRIVSKYSLSDFGFGKGPTQSIRTILKGPSSWNRLKRHTRNLLIRFFYQLTNMA